MARNLPTPVPQADVANFLNACSPEIQGALVRLWQADLITGPTHFRKGSMQGYHHDELAFNLKWPVSERQAFLSQNPVRPRKEGWQYDFNLERCTDLTQPMALRVHVNTIYPNGRGGSMDLRHNTPGDISLISQSSSDFLEFLKLIEELSTRKIETPITMDNLLALADHIGEIALPSSPITYVVPATGPGHVPKVSFDVKTIPAVGSAQGQERGVQFPPIGSAGFNRVMAVPPSIVL